MKQAEKRKKSLQEAFFTDHPEETAETFLSNRLQRTLRHRQCHRFSSSTLETTRDRYTIDIF